MVKTGGSLEVLFNAKCKMQNAKCEEERVKSKEQADVDENCSLLTHLPPHCSLIEDELLQVTKFVDQNSHMTRLNEHKAQIKQKN